MLGERGAGLRGGGEPNACCESGGLRRGAGPVWCAAPAPSAWLQLQPPLSAESALCGDDLDLRACTRGKGSGRLAPSQQGSSAPSLSGGGARAPPHAHHPSHLGGSHPESLERP